MQLNLSHGICSLKIQTAACSWWHYAPDSRTVFFLHLHSITLLRIKDRLSRWQMPGSRPTPTSHSKDWDHIGQNTQPRFLHAALGSEEQLSPSSHRLMQKIRPRSRKEGRRSVLPHGWPVRPWSGVYPQPQFPPLSRVIGLRHHFSAIEHSLGCEANEVTSVVRWFVRFQRKTPYKKHSDC